MRLKLIVGFEIQKLLLQFSYSFFALKTKVKERTNWAIGVGEVAGLNHMLGKVVDNSITVNFFESKYYHYTYTYERFKFASQRIEKIVNFLFAPLLLGKLINNCEGFIFIGNKGFLISDIDQREFEFDFITRKKGKIIAYFVGSDIRSPNKMMEEYFVSGEYNYANYFSWIIPNYMSEEYEKVIIKRADVANKYARIIYSAKYDQRSYLRANALQAPLFMPMENLSFDDSKFETLRHGRIRICHAPTSPIVKGTQVIRTIIDMLKNDGFEFEYTELLHTSNEHVLEILKKSHIAINELYAFSPGIFTIEALMASCAVLTRADSKFESDLPTGANSAWLVTPPYLLYENLRQLLENPESIRLQARSGFEWCKANYSLECNKDEFNKLIRQ